MPNKRVRANGTGTVFKMKNGKWRAEVTLGYEGKKRISKTKSGFTRKKDALEALVALRNDPTSRDPNVKFYELYDLWSAGHYSRITRSTEDVFRAAYKNCKELHYRRINELKTADLQAVVDACELSRRSKFAIKSLINCIYKYAIENDYCQKNYAEFIRLPQKEKSKKDAFTPDEIKKLWKVYENGNDFAGYILIMIYTGMRYGEISTIQKDNIHLAERYMIGGIKTDAGKNREIPIAEKIYSIVQRFYDEADNKLLDLPEKKFYSQYRATIKAAGVRDLNPHSCRHTFATLMANAGIQPAVITATAGHEDYGTTMGYTHIKLNEKLKAANSI